jgi:hypothetical protein
MYYTKKLLLTPLCMENKVIWIKGKVIMKTMRIVILTVLMFVLMACSSKSILEQSEITVKSNSRVSIVAKSGADTYRWREISGIEVKIVDPYSQRLEFVAPDVSKKEMLVFELEAHFGDTVQTAKATVMVVPSKKGDGVDDNNNATNTNIQAPHTLTLTIPKTTLNKETNTTIKLTATYDDNTTKDVTDQAEWIVVPSDAVKVNSSTLTAKKDGNVTLQAKVGNTLSNVLKLNITWVVDVTPPVIILNGEANITLEQDAVYTELGATATDDRDGNVSVKINGVVDTNITGSYIIYYSASDSSGNTATVTRTVTIEKRIESPHIVISDELNSTLSENTIPYNHMTLEIPATSTQTLTAINTTLSQEQNRTIRVKGVDNNGTFYLYNIPLIKGTNKIELHAVNEIDEEVIQSITIKADANLSVPIGMRATAYEGVQSLETEVKVGTGLDAKEYLFDDEGDGIIDQTSTEGNFTVNLTEEGRYKPRVTIRTQNNLLYSSGSYALSLDVKADENQTDPVGAQPVDVAKEFVKALIEDDRDTVETLLMSSSKWLKMLYSNDQRRVNMIEKLKNINNNSWEQNYHPSGAATVTATVYDTGSQQEIPIGFELTPTSFDSIPRGHFWFVRAFY